MFNPFAVERKTGIRIIRIYDGFRMDDEIIATPPKQTNKTLEDMIDKPKRYANHMKFRDQLLGIPQIKICTLTEPETLEDHDIDIIAEITYTYNMVIPESKTHPAVMLMYLSFAGALVIAIFALIMANALTKPMYGDMRCTYYLKNGIPQSLVVEGIEYDLDEEGKLSAIDSINFNPYHMETIKNGGCIKIDTER